MTYEMITDFYSESFQEAFRKYFAEFGVSVGDWDAMFRELSDEGGNRAFLKTAEDGAVTGFILFQPILFSSSFFEETCGFIRELWVEKSCRNRGYATELIGFAEKYFKENGIFTTILTTDAAEQFYEKCGYAKALGCKAKNQDPVFVKRLT